ncbi:Thiolase, N-terminal domain-containing protein [Cladorrhinum samala]|uniref:acetyl-CoA C-acyltransferase n=1 Tax=Cladorrhinum samala TaxID=585594 RepID=A0AAV9HMM1_9PEZI|nr:Thiolase, N-terminal domain-containing protein [Cladorrhinum samala]
MAVLPRGIKQVLAKAPTDVVIVSSLRTPICRSYKGGLKDAYPEELLSVVLRATLDKNPQLDPKKIDDVAVGVVLNELGGSKAARMALNHVGFDTSSTSLYTANRACASSLQAIALVAAQIRTEMIDVGIGAGMESMTRNYGTRAIPVDVWPELKESPVKDARDCVMSMGITSENVAERYGVSRADQDALAVESHLRAARAQEKGHFDDEIVPVRTRWQEVSKTGEKVGEEKEITVARDDGVRANASLEGLAKLKPAFKSDGASTAGNSSQVSDGAAATLLMRRSTATQLGLTGSIMGKFVGASVSGCRPDEMGIGPALAIPKILGQLGLANEDVHRWEINEAFASQALYCIRELGLEKALAEGRVNPDGGAIALGHPLGATGARMVSTLMHGMRRTGGEVGVVSMCIGTGMGMAGVFVRE